MKHIILIFTLLFSLTIISAQEPTAAVNNTIEAQFDQTIKEAGKYQDYKVVKLVKLNQLKSATVKEIDGLNGTIDELESTITGLESKMANLTEQGLWKKNSS